MKIASWNINSIKSRLQHVINWSDRNQPDVLCLQETKCPDDRFPEKKLREIGFEHQAFFGEAVYHGVAILSRHPLDEVRRGFPNDVEDEQRRLVAATVNGVRIVNIYAPHGTKLGSDRYRYKLAWFQKLRRYFDENYMVNDDVVLCGDLNVAPHEIDVWKVALWKNKLHFTKAEREAIQHLKAWGFIDLFRFINDEAREFTWWDYFHPHSWEWNKGLRLDHIWASPPLADRCADCWIDTKPRALERPSDHAPVIAEFAV